MEDSDNREVEIDIEIYERLAILSMKLGRDNVTDFVNDMLYLQMIREQAQEAEG